MRAEVVSMTADNLDMEAIRRGGDILKQGGLVAFPTETVYGLGGDALNPQASMKIYAAKGRPSDNPLIVHIAEFDKLAPIVAEVPEKAIDSLRRKRNQTTLLQNISTTPDSLHIKIIRCHGYNFCFHFIPAFLSVLYFI